MILRQKQVFALFRQKNKRIGSFGKALKPPVFLTGSKFRLRIPVGKRNVSQTLPMATTKKGLERDLFYFALE